jgi:2-keto-4-pentenoate hydratase/2-oxohepta-3-ene-1,7-dioic acid hydratase in catechol pathway
MRLLSFATNSDPATVHVGVELADSKQVVSLNNAMKLPNLTMRQFLELGDDGIAQAQKLVDSAVKEKSGLISIADVKIKAPLRDPQKIICIGMNYVDHCTEQNMPIPTEPVVFSKFANSIIDVGDPILLEETEQLDFEVELVIVVGKKCKRVEAKEAMQYVAGYTVAHDVSARDWQLKRNGGQWLIGKSMDSYLPFGPAIVTRDEVGDAHNLGIRCFLNGETVQDSNTNQLVFRTEAIIEHLSRFFTLVPGDVILTGTPPGVGAFRKPPLWLKNGDVVKVEIDKLGSLTNTVVAPSATAKRALDDADATAAKKAKH